MKNYKPNSKRNCNGKKTKWKTTNRIQNETAIEKKLNPKLRTKFKMRLQLKRTTNRIQHKTAMEKILMKNCKPNSKRNCNGKKTKWKTTNRIQNEIAIDDRIDGFLFRRVLKLPDVFATLTDHELVDDFLDPSRSGFREAGDEDVAGSSLEIPDPFHRAGSNHFFRQNAVLISNEPKQNCNSIVNMNLKFYCK